MQRWSATVLPTPGLYIIEDATGSGKTEAALMLAHRLIAAGHAEGLYIALPTMATSDQMHERLGAVYRRLFQPERTPSLILAHGGRDLNLNFRRSLLDPTSDSYCAEWIAHDRRTAFLAQVGVGTVDQALMAVLPSYCQCIRIIGLMQRVLVLDEVHAYDAFMSQEIERLLQFQAAMGGSTILLSATLPADTKRRLIQAYGGQIETPAMGYPLSTVYADRLTETLVDPRPSTVRTVGLHFVDTPQQGLAIALDAARAGQAVLYIRNTIRDAVEIFQTLPDDVSASLFHARFAMCDRQAIQANTLRRFDKASRDKDREHLLIATQVVEQSLDLDFDLIVTDLAPVDLIIQRAGRLWRHERVDRTTSARRELVVVGPGPWLNATADWLWGTMSGSAAVYRDHARMWLTAQTLRASGTISSPHGLRGMIEHVYRVDVADHVPEALAQIARQQEAERGVHRGAASASTLKLSSGYAHTTEWASDEVISTRLGRETATVRLAGVRDGRVVPWASIQTEETDPRRLWAMSEVSVEKSWADCYVIPPALQAAADATRLRWPRWMRDERPLLIVGDDGTISVSLHYSPVLGLRRIIDEFAH